MPTVIYFTGSSGDNALMLKVDESVEDLVGILSAGHGAPVPLTGVGRAEGQRVYVNPTTIAFWRDAPDRGGASFM